VNAAAFGALRGLTEGRLLSDFSPEQRWEVLAGGLMSAQPDAFVRVLRGLGVLAQFLPEIEAWYGVPQMSDGSAPVDVGVHQERVLAESAKQGAPLVVRFAALMHKLGKAGTPREILPSHYKHEVRGHLALDAIAKRVRVPSEALELAHLAINEADRVHRASVRRAGAITLMLARIRALEQPERFEHLLALCTCDYAAYEGHTAAEYPKAAILRTAARVCAHVNVDHLDDEEALDARTEAVVEALRSFAHFDAEAEEAQAL
jgi:tRNA nucleotidyltransferase (CCA-adding enzyme)